MITRDSVWQLATMATSPQGAHFLSQWPHGESLAVWLRTFIRICWWQNPYHLL